MKIIKSYYSCLSESKKASLKDLGLLVLRVSIGLLMAFGHGLGKLQKLFSDAPIQFADPIGIGVTASLALSGLTEFFLSIFIVFGIFTRLATIPLIFNMVVALCFVHLHDPFSRMEPALLYLVPYVTLLLTGAGKISADSLLRKKFLQ